MIFPSSLQHLLEEAVSDAAAPLVGALEAIDVELAFSTESTVGPGESLQGLGGPVGDDEVVAGADLPDARPGGDQRADFRHVAVAEQTRDDLGATAVPDADAL